MQQKLIHIVAAFCVSVGLMIFNDEFCLSINYSISLFVNLIIFLTEKKILVY
jgi:hypothetical protein